MPHDTQAPKPTLLSIPPELRIPIYEYALSIPIKFRQHSSTTKAKTFFPDRKHADESELRLLQTCRQIFHEAKPIYYQINPLYFGELWSLIHFFDSPSSARAPYMRSLTLSASILCPGGEIPPLLQRFTKTRVLYIELSPSSAVSACADGIRKAVSELRGLEEFRILVQDSGWVSKIVEQNRKKATELEEELRLLVLLPKEIKPDLTSMDQLIRVLVCHEPSLPPCLCEDAD